MKYALFSLLFLLLIGGCKNAQVSHQPFVFQGDSLQAPPFNVNGWELTRLNANEYAYIPPVVPKKLKLKNVGNDYSKVKDAGNIDIKDKSTVKDKSKVKPKTKADIIGDGNSQIKPESKSKTDWIRWLSLAIIVLVLGYVFGPIIRNFLKR